MNVKFAVAVAAIGVLAGCGGVPGNGDIRQEVREVGAFEAVNVSFGLTAEVRLGETTSVTIEADENLLPLFVTEVKDGRLDVTLDNAFGLFPTASPKVTIVTPRLTAVEASGGSTIVAWASEGADFTAVASGGSTVTVCELSTERVSATASGGSRIKLVGTSHELTAVFSGGSGLDSRGLGAESVTLDGSGGAYGKLIATSELSGSISGGSVFTVRGSPSTARLATSGGSFVRYDN
ncbi:MAG: head GIN domain-containing protein [Myxococcaceae bacterium]